MGEGNLGISAKIETNDEIGELANSFNTMMSGLAERDRVRDLLGKVVSMEIAEELLSKDIELGGEEREVTSRNDGATHQRLLPALPAP